jgi:hypothetical protein
MCHQSVGLIQGLVEREGIPTVSITLLAEVTRKIDPPRALFVDKPLGYPLGEPDNPELQRRIILAALSLLSEDQLPVLESFPS